MCTAHQQRQCSCRQRSLQRCMDRLRRFRCNRSVLWTYWHRPVAWFPLWRWVRQSKYGRRGGNLGRSTTVDLLHCRYSQRAPFACWLNLVILPPPCTSHGCYRWEGAWGFSCKQEGGRKIVHGGGYDRVTRLTTIFWCVTFDTLFVGEKVWWGHDVNMVQD